MMIRTAPAALALAVAAALAACGGQSSQTGATSAAPADPAPVTQTPAAQTPAAGTSVAVAAGDVSEDPALGIEGKCEPDERVTDALRDKVDHIVVIYAENRSFDNLYGRFRGANGLGRIVDAAGKPRRGYVAQKDRDGGTVLSELPMTWSGVTMPGVTPAVTQAQSAGLANAPFPIETAFQRTANATLGLETVTRDLVHRFFENQMQIGPDHDNSMFAAWTDAGGLTMGHMDYSRSALWKLAKENVLADNFFAGAFGGSFLNHQYLICACAPEYPADQVAIRKPTVTKLDTDAKGAYVPRLTLDPASPPSAMDGPPKFAMSGNLVPQNYFGDGRYYAVNTMQPPFQPSGNAPVTLNGNDALYADASKATTLPALTTDNIGDLLSRKGVSWRWYGGAWNAALMDGMQDPKAKRSVIYSGNATGWADSAHLDFQPHHQPFNYYSRFDPVTGAAERAEHLRDGDDLVSDAARGTLPAVSFYKPEGLFNQHPGYANVVDGDQKIMAVIDALKKSPQWKRTVVVVTYDEFGGAWDHVAPPKADLIGPGTRIPAIIVSPIARHGRIDHTQYDTASTLRLITRRFDLPQLPGLRQRDDALQAAGLNPMGDLTPALDL